MDIKPYKGKQISKEEEDLRSLKRKSINLWTKVVKARAGNKCEACGSTAKGLNAHHIESSALNKTLRHDPRNGLCLDTRCHKFGRLSAHHSFCFMYQVMTSNRMDDLMYLLEQCQVSTKLTKEFLTETVRNLEEELAAYDTKKIPTKKFKSRRSLVL